MSLTSIHLINRMNFYYFVDNMFSNIPSHTLYVYFLITKLNGGLHGVDNVWQPSFLERVKSVIRTPHLFMGHEQWNNKKNDQRIVVFGGPYVLGQDINKLTKLILALPHNDITKMLCQGKNIIYTLIHLGPVAAPGTSNNITCFCTSLLMLFFFLFFFH